MVTDLERTTGELRIMRDAQVATIYLSSGQIVDVEGLGELTRREQLAELCRWNRGDSALVLKEVGRPDRVGVPTAALLIELAQAQDEANPAA